MDQFDKGQHYCIYNAIMSWLKKFLGQLCLIGTYIYGILIF